MERAYQPPSTMEEWSSHPYASAYQSLTTPHNPSPLHNSVFDPYASGAASGSGADKRQKMGIEGMGSSDGEDGEEGEEDEEEDEGEKKDTGKRKGKEHKAKLTRGSRACIPCRKIKMRCIPDPSSGPSGPCKRCKSGGHECIFEESNRGKRSTRKNEALTARLAKMEAALKGIGAALSAIDQPSLNSFSTALHGSVTEPETINLITSYTSPAAVTTLSVAMNRSFIHADTFVQGYNGDSTVGGLSHMSHAPLSPRLHSLPDNVLSPLGLLAEASLQNTPKGQGRFGRPSPFSLDGRQMGRNGSGQLRDAAVNRVMTSDVRGGEIKAEPGEEGGNGAGTDMGRGAAVVDSGIASQNYFKPTGVGVHVGPPGNRLPELLTIVKREEISDLFTLFYDNMATHVPLIYREFHTPELVIQRSQFLCTVICAIAARHYTAKPELHSALSAYAKRLAFEVPSRGYKSVEVVQAYLLLALWTLGPEKTFEQDRTWMMLGMAIRMATDLNLHRKSVPSGLDTEEGHARDLEIINRERTWLHCFILDRSIAAQMGKPYTVREDYIIRKACEGSWHNQKFSLVSDRAMAAYVCLQVIMSRAIDSIYSSTSTINGLRTDADYMMIVRSAHEELRRWLNDWNNIPNVPFNPWDSRAQFYFSYHSLVLYSFGLENALERSRMDISYFLANVYEAATRVCTIIKEQFVPSGYLRYVPDTNFVMCSYALLSLLKLLKPELRTYHDSEEAIFKLVSEMADHLEQCATDPSHQPAIYSAFIREIVRKTREARQANLNSAHPSRASSPVPGASTGMTAMGSNGTIDPVLTKGNGMPGVGAGAGQGMQQQQQGQQQHQQQQQHQGMINGDNMGVFDPALLDENVIWGGGDMGEAGHFTFIPQGGDMMILPSAAGPSESIQNSPSATYLSHFPGLPTGLSDPGPTPGPGAPQATTNVSASSAAAAAATGGWAEYLPTFMSSDGFDGWDGSMLLPGFGRGQITLSGGLLHSQFGSGIITPAQHTPSQSRAGSRQASRQASPVT